MTEPASLSLVVPAIAGLMGVGLGALLSATRDRTQRRLAFMQNQVEGFYSPMLGLRNQVKIASDLRIRIQDKADVAWRELCAAVPNRDVAALQALSKERGPQFKELIEYDNQQLREALLPAYREMAELFRSKYWLAESETQSHYAELVEFVELWNRWIAGSLPHEVLLGFEHSESKLQPFYEHIECIHASLRRQLRSGTPD